VSCSLRSLLVLKILIEIKKIAAVILLRTTILRFHGQPAVKQFTAISLRQPGIAPARTKIIRKIVEKKLFALHVINKLRNLCDHRIVVIETDKDAVI